MNYECLESVEVSFLQSKFDIRQFFCLYLNAKEAKVYAKVFLSYKAYKKNKRNKVLPQIRSYFLPRIKRINSNF